MIDDETQVAIILAEYAAGYAVVILAVALLILGTIGRRWFK